jgi:hypothetical protein
METVRKSDRAMGAVGQGNGDIGAAGGRVLLLVHDPLSARVFFECGIVERLLDRLGNRLDILATFNVREYPAWQTTWKRGHLIVLDEWLAGQKHSMSARMLGMIDRYLDKRIGFFPLALRLNMRHGFHAERMSRGHRNTYLDLSRKGPLPINDSTYRFMFWWLYGRFRFLDGNIRRYLQQEIGVIVSSHLQSPGMIPFILAARRLGIPIIGYIASWDHLVGKGVVFPGCVKYVVQNDTMKSDLQKYHGIEENHISVTGWPQTDLFVVRRPKAEYDKLIASFGLDSTRPTVLVTGNSVTNAPYEPAFFKKLLSWWEAEGGCTRFNLLFRPHPKDSHWRERFDVQSLSGKPGIYVQPATFTDMEVLSLLLQHVACVITNAGTILLDSLVNNRPAISVLYDEGAAEGSSYALKNVVGEHYKELMASSAFYRAHDFAAVSRSIEASLANPDELAEQRRKVAAQIVGKIDGQAGRRVVDTIMASIPDTSTR